MNYLDITNITVLLCIIILDAMIISLPLRYGWLKHRQIELYFPEWKNTKRAIIWFLSWSFCILLNIVIISLVFIFNDIVVSTILSIIAFLYLPFVYVLYRIVKHNIRYMYDKRSERLEKEREAKEKTEKTEEK